MVRGSGMEDDALHHEGMIAPETPSCAQCGAVVADLAARDSARPTAGVVAVVALLAATSASALPNGIATHEPGLVTPAAATIRAGVVRGPHGGVAAGRAVGTTRPVAPRPVVRPLPPPGRWVRPTSNWWKPGMAVAAGAAIGFVSAAAAASWAGSPPAPGYCWYYTDADRTKGFWDVCPK